MNELRGIETVVALSQLNQVVPPRSPLERVVVAEELSPLRYLLYNADSDLSQVVKTRDHESFKVRVTFQIFLACVIRELLEVLLTFVYQ